MAKLSAHGRELLRTSRERNIDPEARTIVNGQDLGKTLTTWERETRSYRSDGHIMLKVDVRFSGDRIYPEGRLHSYGWKLYKKLKKDATVTIEDLAKKWVATIEAGNSSWKVEYKSLAL